MEYTATPDWMEKIFGREKPDITLKLVPCDSPNADKWDDWLCSEGHPLLTEIGIQYDGQYLMPITVPADKYDKMSRGIAVRLVKYLRNIY